MRPEVQRPPVLGRFERRLEADVRAEIAECPPGREHPASSRRDPGERLPAHFVLELVEGEPAAIRGGRVGRGQRECQKQGCRHLERWRTRKRRPRARFPQSPDEHQRRERFRVRSMKSHEQSGQIPRGYRGGCSRRDANARATGHQGRSRSDGAEFQVGVHAPRAVGTRRACARAARRAACTRATTARDGSESRASVLPTTKIVSRSVRARRSAAAVRRLSCAEARRSRRASPCERSPAALDQASSAS